MGLQSLEEPDPKGPCRTQETNFILSEMGSHKAGKQSNNKIQFLVCKDPSLNFLAFILCCSDMSTLGEAE